MNKILEIKFGSHLYGTNNENSDLDFKAIYLPTARDIVLHTYKKTEVITRQKKEGERNTKDDIDIEIFSLDRFLDQLMEGQTFALDILFAPWQNGGCIGEGADIMSEIFLNKDRLLTKNINAFVGYARKQAAKYGIKGTRMDALKNTVALLETFNNYEKLEMHADAIHKLVADSKELVSLEKTPLIEIQDIPAVGKDEMIPHLVVCGRKIGFTSTVKLAKDCFGKILAGYGDRAIKANLAGGKDWKAISHAVRVNTEALELLKTGRITFPRPDRELLLQIKEARMEWDKVAELIEIGVAELHEEQAKSTMRAEPDYDWANDFIYQIYSNIVKEG
jgi:hypothetical protein